MNEEQTKHDYITPALHAAGWHQVEGSRIRLEFPITDGRIVGSDLYDVLSYIAYKKELMPRLERAAKAKLQIMDYNPKQQAFLNFVLKQYVREGVNELDDDKLPRLLELKYEAIADAKEELGQIKSIRDAFIGFQKNLYDEKVS